MVVLNLVALAFWLIVGLVVLRFIAKNISTFLAMGLFIAGYLVLFNTAGSILGYGPVILAGLIGAGVMFRTMAAKLEMGGGPKTSFREQMRLDADDARRAAEEERRARDDQALQTYWARSNRKR